ncbi:hypothetical protein D3C77_484250 [compost metagenome]
MRDRGDKYRTWADCKHQSHSHEEELDNGTEIDIQVRLSPMLVTQVLIGVYAKGGRRLFEKIHDGSGATLAHALRWGVGRARVLATSSPSAPPMDLHHLH